MAKRKTTGKTNKKGKSHALQAVVLFWLIFFIVIISVFVINQKTIKENFELFKNRLTSPSGAEEELLDDEEETVVIEPPPAPPARQTAPAVTQTPEVKPQEKTPEPPQIQPAQKPETPAQLQPPPQQQPAPVQMRDRAVYFTQINSDGQILQSKVTRRVPASDSPMQDALNVLLAGPTTEELNRGILNLIPQNTRLLSATVRGNTAYISFSEDFLFNTFGVEGYVAQLRQIVWTVTEFSNVKDCQILIEGGRMDYLGEGIWIGSPIGRQNF